MPSRPFVVVFKVTSSGELLFRGNTRLSVSDIFAVAGPAAPFKIWLKKLYEILPVVGGFNDSLYVVFTSFIVT